MLRQLVEAVPSMNLGDLHWYDYAGDNPLTYVDPLGLRVKNSTNCVIYIKEDTSGKTHPVPPGGEWPGEQDGYADPCTHPYEVFKTTDHVDVTVDANHDPHTSGGMWLIGQALRGGWKDTDWMNDLQKKGDHGWDDLFRNSRPNNCTCCKK